MRLQRRIFIVLIATLPLSQVWAASNDKALQRSILNAFDQSQRILNRFEQTDSATIERFLSNHNDLYHAKTIRAKYLQRLLANRQMNKFVQTYRADVNDVSLQCHYLSQTVNRNTLTSQQDQQIEKLWLTASSRPDSCNRVFKTWNQAGKLTSDRVWQRIELAIGKGRYRLANFVAKSYLPKSQQDIVKLWIEVRQNPAKKLTTTRFSSTARAGQIIADGLEQMARKQPAAAANLWQTMLRQNKALAKFSPQVYAGIGFRAANNRQPNASQYLLKASAKREEVRQWSMRAAIWESNWPNLITFFDRLTDEEKQVPDWRYWQARALEQTGKPKQAKEVYQSIAGERDFYGFLAADKIGSKYQMNNHPIQASTESLAANKAFLAAKVFAQTGDTQQMRRQWQWAIRDLNRTELATAAKLAGQWGLHDRAIITAGRARYFNDVDLRFPLTHKKAILQQAKKNKLPPAYAYGILRQESAFMQDVRSSAGAMGLMQIMPATGKLIWKKQNKPNYRSERLLIANENIAAGSFYLRDMLNTFDENFAMASAAYNAGPGRPKQWRPENTIAADIWIENIPFKETRGYVKNVLEYMAVYNHLLGLPMQRISELIPSIKP